MNRFKSVFALLADLTLVAGALLTGCNHPKSSIEERKDIRTELNGQGQGTRIPVLYAVFDDKSGSAKAARITPFREQDLLTLIDNLRLTGGELAFGLIGESTDQPLLRLRIPVLPAYPIKSPVENAFERAEQDALFQERMEKYEAELVQRNKNIDERVAAFMGSARTKLQEKPIAKTSPINLALSRSELFLNEPATAWPQPPHRYILLNSDAIDTTNSASVPIKSNAKLVLINGTGSLGTLGGQNPLRFESIQAALDFIAARELGSNK